MNNEGHPCVFLLITRNLPIHGIHFMKKLIKYLKWEITDWSGGWLEFINVGGHILVI